MGSGLADEENAIGKLLFSPLWPTASGKTLRQWTEIVLVGQLEASFEELKPKLPLAFRSHVTSYPEQEANDSLGRVLINAQMSGLEGLSGNVPLGQSIAGLDPRRTKNLKG